MNYETAGGLMKSITRGWRNSKLVPPGSRGRGFTLVWLAISLIALLALAALGIDMGRVQLTRTELQHAADAAALAAAWPIPQLEFEEATARAQTMVDSNQAGGDAIGFDLSQQDLQFGIWWRNTRTFQPLEPDEYMYANAALVRGWRHADRGNPMRMNFAGVIGIPWFDVGADAVAQVRGGFGAGSGGIGIFGRDWVQANGTTRTDSYDSSAGPYDPGSAGNGGGIGTNGWLEIIGTSDINGNARWGSDGDTNPEGDYIEVWPEADVTGWRAPYDEEIIFPPVTEPENYDNQPLLDAGLLETRGKWKDGVVVSGAAQVTIPGGTAENPAVYYVSTLQLNSNTIVSIDGAVEFYVYGPVDLTGSVTVLSDEGSWPIPSNFKIFVIGEGPVEIGGGSALHAQIYAPEADVKIHGTSSEFGLFGGVIGKTVDILGNSAIHVDSNLEWPGDHDRLRVELVH